MKFGYLRQDDDGHWYLLEEDCVNQFSYMQEKIYLEKDWEKREDLIDLFIEAFEGNRLSGGIGNLKVLIE